MTGGVPGWHREILGDIVRDERWLSAARLPILRWTWRIGAPRDNPPGGPAPAGHTAPGNGRIDATMDLQADQQVTLSGSYTDEAGNPVDPPTVATVAYTVDDPTSVTLPDNGDGTATAAATGTLGTANVHAEADLGGGRTATGDLQSVVIAGDAERFAIAASDPSEVTPDV